MYRYLFIFFFLFSCSNMKEITLYKNLPSNSNVNNSLGQFSSTEIFTKGGTDEVWGNSDERL